MHKQNIIIFDGVCNLCNSSIKFITIRDKDSRFTFLSFQNDAAKKLMAKYHFDIQNIDTIILIKQNKSFIKSDAVLEISKDLQGYWFILSYLSVIPKFIRDFMYDFISKNRYRFFGKSDSCKL